MAKLFVNQAKQYLEGRPSYPQELFQFISSKTPSHRLAWDVGCGSGQASQSLAGIYKNIIATDTSPTQLEYAVKLPNIRYQCTSPNMSMAELEQITGPEPNIDLVTIAQALHWFNLSEFYQQVKWALKKPNGVIAAWCYTVPEVNPNVDSVFQKFYTIDTEPYWDPARKLVDQHYETIDFPFGAVDGLDGTGPFRFNAERLMDFEGYLRYISSWSAYQTAKEKGVELLGEKVVDDFKKAWNEDGVLEKVVTHPVYLRIGKAGTTI